MRTLIAWTMILAVGTSARAQGNAAKKPATPPAAAKAKPAAPLDPAAEKARLEDEANRRVEMDRVLVEWEERSKQVTSLDVSFDRVDRSEGWGNQYYQGRAMLQSPDLACLQFQKYKLDGDGKPVFTTSKDGKSVPQLEAQPFERIVCTGAEVLQYTWDDKKIFIYPLDKQARQKTLQQGPLPFLFNMKAADARRRYSMTLLNQNAKDYLIGIRPNEQIDKESFTQAFLWLSKQTFLPNQLWLYPVGEKERQEFVFAGNSNTIQANTPLKKDFFLPTRYEGWNVIENPNADGAPAQGKAVVLPGQPPRRAANQPAAKPPMRPK